MLFFAWVQVALHWLWIGSDAPYCQSAWWNSSPGFGEPAVQCLADPPSASGVRREKPFWVCTARGCERI